MIQGNSCTRRQGLVHQLSLKGLFEDGIWFAVATVGSDKSHAQFILWNQYGI